jgi:OOP family OmpA-OmpF porin
MTPLTMRHILMGGILLLSGILAPACASAATQPEAATAKAPDALDLYFDNGSSAVRSEDEQLLDKASRLYAEGKPIVMIVAGSADQVGPPALNLRLSQERADNVVRGLVARGIPVERFQVLAKGVSELPVPDAISRAEARNRRVEITWH